ncbi:MAG TPA: glycosidase, partial [Anaerolineae bacterium]|nr:glycosidase [Anaerolineae bacterium]
GAALLDLEEPWKVIARTPEPILEPEEEYERIGDVPNVVFPEGVVVIGGELLVFYGAADKVCCVASVRLNELVNYLLVQRE